MMKRLGILILVLVVAAVWAGVSEAQQSGGAQGGAPGGATGAQGGSQTGQPEAQPGQPGTQPGTMQSQQPEAQPGATTGSQPETRTGETRATGSQERGTGAAGAMNFKAEHNMTGTITKIDKDKDLVSLRTDEGTLLVHLPGASKDLKEGDRITVHLGYMKGEKSGQ